MTTGIPRGARSAHVLADLEAAAIRGLPTLTPPAQKALAAGAHAANQAFGQVVSKVPLDLEAAFVTRKAFHASFTDPLAGPRLAWLLSLVWPQVERYEWFYGALLQGELEVATTEHDAISARSRPATRRPPTPPSARGGRTPALACAA